MQIPKRWFLFLAIAGTLGSSLLVAAPAGAEEEEDAESPETPEAPAPTPPPGVEVLRVRGRGLAEIQTDVPSSVTTFDAATIEALGAQDVSDLSRVTPNVSIVQPGATQATFFIRGIGLSDFSSNAAGAVTIFQDDVAINAPAIQTGQIFDIEGVDIVRGPQGTGHFRNASGGAIRVRSQRPTGNYSAQLRATRGRYHAGGGLGGRHAIIQEYEGFLETPLVGDVLSSRFAFRLRDDEPWKENGCGNLPPVSERPTRRDGLDMGIRGQENLSRFISRCGELGNFLETGLDGRSTLPAGLPRHVGDAHNWAARGTFRLTPPESDWDVVFNAHGSRLDQQSTLGQAIGTAAFQFANNVDKVGFFGGQTNSLGQALYQEPDIFEEFRGRDGESGLCALNGTGACTNPTAQLQLARNLTRRRPLDIRPYRGDFNRVGQTTRDAYGAFASAEGKLGDYDLFFLASYDGYQRSADQDVDFTPDELIVGISEDEAWQTYEEVRVAGELAATPFAWELGGYFLYENLQDDVFNSILDGNANVSRDIEQDIYSGGVWGKFSWDFLEDLTLEGGVRLNVERKDFDYFVDSDFTGTLAAQQSETWVEPTGELILTWHIDERAQAYGRYTRGFKAGHYNSVATARLDDLLAEPESNDAYEAGLRGAFWDGRVRGAAAFFYYQYRDFQVFLFSDVAQQPPTLEIVNASEAELFGVEVEGMLRPLEGLVPRWMEQLQISGNFSWLQGQYLDFQDVQGFVSGGGFSTVTFDFSGNDLASAPDYKVSGAVEWTLELGRFGDLIPRYDIAWTDDQFFDPREGRGSIRTSGVGGSLPKLAIAQPAFFLHNIRLAYRTPSGNVEIAGWVRNLTDEVYKTFAFDASRFAGLVINFTGEPRTMGVDVVFTF